VQAAAIVLGNHIRSEVEDETGLIRGTAKRPLEKFSNGNERFNIKIYS
jgi:hypothetical protein